LWAGSPPIWAWNPPPGQAWELGYEVVIAKEATTSLAADLHDFAITKIFPLISRVTERHLIRLSIRSPRLLQ